jgi:hypothetical protein
MDLKSSRGAVVSSLRSDSTPTLEKRIDDRTMVVD